MRVSFRRRTLLAEAAGIFLLAFVVLALAMDRSLRYPYDEGIILTGAMRLAAGDMIHRDFYANYGPLAFEPVAWLFRFMGQQVIAVRLVDVVIRSLAVALGYALIARNTGNRGLAWMASAVSGMWLVSVGNPGYPMYPCWVWALSGTMLFARTLRGESGRARAFLAGLCTGFCALVRYDAGFMVGVAHLVATGIMRFRSRAAAHDARIPRGREIAIYVAGAALPVVLLLVWYANVGALDGFVHDVIQFPIANYARTRSLPFPEATAVFRRVGFVQLGIYLPVAVVAVFAIGAILGRWRPEPAVNTDDRKEPTTALAVALGCLTIALYGKGIVRVSVEHLQPAIFASILLLAVGLGGWRPAWPALRWAVWSLAFLMVLTAATSAYQELRTRRHLVIREFGEFVQTVMPAPPASDVNPGQPAEQRHGPATVPFFVSSDRAAAINYITEHTTKNDRLLVGLNRHDKVYMNDVSAYTLTHRLPATKWHHYDPGLQTSFAIQQEMVTELERYAPPCIWIESTWDDIAEPNDSAISSGVHILDDYLAKKYAPAQHFGTITILVRR